MVLLEGAQGINRVFLARIREIQAVIATSEFIREECDNGAEEFQRLLAFAKEAGLVTDNLLKDLGQTTQSTANRWMNGRSIPPPASRETILRKLELEMMRQIRDLTTRFDQDEWFDQEGSSMLATLSDEHRHTNRAASLS